MATYDEILKAIDNLRDAINNAIAQSKIAPDQITVITGLSDISKRLGLVLAGEFRAGNGKEPGSGFSGMRIGYPPFNYAGRTWHLVGVNNDKLKAGLSADDGAIYAADGSLTIDESGIHMVDANILAYSIESETSKRRLYFIGGFDVVGYAAFSTRGNIDGRRFGTVTLMSSVTYKILNGDFSTGTSSSWTITGAPTVVQDSPDGVYSIDVDGNNYVSQDITTVSGQDYLLEFYGKSTEIGGAALPTVVVNGSSIFPLRIIGGDSWVKCICLFRATGASTTISFKGSGTENARYTNIKVWDIYSWSYTSDYDSDVFGNLELVSSNKIHVMCGLGTGGSGAGFYQPVAINTNLNFGELSSTPSTPSSGAAMNVYMKGDKFIIQYNDGGTVRWKYLDLTGTGVTWTATTTPP